MYFYLYAIVIVCIFNCKYLYLPDHSSAGGPLPPGSSRRPGPPARQAPVPPGYCAQDGGGHEGGRQVSD